MDLSSVGSQGSIYDLVDQYMQLEQIPRDKLVDRKTALSDSKSIFSELDSKLSALKTKLDYFTDIFSNPFFAKTSTSSDSEKVQITSQGSAVTGNHSIAIERLAQSDTRVSNQFDSSATSFSGISTDQTFTIEVGHPTDEDPDNRVEISVTVEASSFSDTDNNVIKAISDAINDAMAQAVTDELIDGDEVINSSVVSEELGTSRMVLRSDQTGYSYRMDFGASSLLDSLGVNAAVQSSGTSGGYMTAVGTSHTDSELNSKFTLDGLTFYRDLNIVDDALSGVTLKLLDTFVDTETVTVQTDVESVKGDVEDFIDKYNEVIKYVRENRGTDAATNTPGAFSYNNAYTSIVSDFRGIMGGSVAGTTSSDYAIMYKIGIEANEDGTLSIKDNDKFVSALETNSLYVSDLFNSENGVANGLLNYVDNFVTAGGTIDTSQSQIDFQITTLNDRISYMNEMLDKKEKLYFDQFTQLQQVMYELQAQQDFFNSILQGGGSLF